MPIVLLMIWLPQPLVAQGPSLVAHERVGLSSKVLGSDQLLYIHLPEGYAETDQEFPVIFVLDPEERFAHTCAAVEHLSAPYIAAIPKAILVGVKSTDRYRDLTTPAGKNWSVPDFIKNHGKADTFIRYLHDEVVPFVESKYRASPFRIVVGHSLGGLFGLHVMAAKPDLFRAYIILDPSTFWNNGAIVDSIAAKFGESRRDTLRLFVADGLVPEGMQIQLEPNEERLLKFLNGLDEGRLRYTYKGLRGESHNEMPFVAVYYGLKAVFADYEPKLSWTLSVEQLESYYQELSRAYGFTVSIPERMKKRGGRN